MYDGASTCGRNAATPWLHLTVGLLLLQTPVDMYIVTHHQRLL
jgi:hypothetical protein